MNCTYVDLHSVLYANEQMRSTSGTYIDFVGIDTYRHHFQTEDSFAESTRTNVPYVEKNFRMIMEIGARVPNIAQLHLAALSGNNAFDYYELCGSDDLGIFVQDEKNGFAPRGIYLEDVKLRTGSYWYNHFNTIGLIGMNEACLNFLGKDITTTGGQAFALATLDFMRTHIARFQEETGHVYNLEATPAEGTSYSLAKLDKERYPGIITAGQDEPYYTNSSQLPVGFTDDIFETLDLQDELQCKYTGGTVLHLYLGEQIRDIELAKQLIRKAFTHYKLPYLSLTPTFSICPEHGYLSGEVYTCPECGRDTEVWSRVVGYLRPVQNFHKGKQEEYKERVKYVIHPEELQA